MARNPSEEAVDPLLRIHAQIKKELNTAPSALEDDQQLSQPGEEASPEHATADTPGHVAAYSPARTARLPQMTLQELTAEDVVAVQRIYSGASVRFLGGVPMRWVDAEQYVADIALWRRANPRRQYVLGITVEGDVIGLIRLLVLTASVGQIGYVLREDSWGRGYATQAVRALLTLAFADIGLETIFAKHHRDNPASGAVLTKAGFASLGPGSDNHERYAIDRCSVHWTFQIDGESPPGRVADCWDAR